MRDEKISVVVAIYNKEKYVRKCIESLINQTYSNLQIILVDDDSYDGTGKICHEYADKDERIIYTCHPKNRGISETRNTGIRFATGEYIAFIDGDDYVLESYIETLYKNAADTGADISVCEYIRTGEDEPVKQAPEKQHLVRVYNDPLSFMGDVEWATAVVVWNKLYRTALFDEIRFPANRIHQDEFIIHHIIGSAEKLVYTDSPRYIYVRSAGSVMRTQSASTFYDGYLALSDRINMLDEKGRMSERDLWIERLLELLITYYNDSPGKNSPVNWKDVFRQKIMMLIRKYPETASCLDGDKKVTITKILNLR